MARTSRVSVTQGQQTRTFASDSLKRLICAPNPESRVGTASCAATLPTSGVDLYTYDANGNLHTHTDPRSVLTTVAYDDLNRASQKSYSGETNHTTPAVNYRWDTVFKGALTSTANSVSTTSYGSYDVMGRPTQISQTPTGQPAFGFQYSYNIAGGLEQAIYPSTRSIATCYDAGGRIAGVSGQAGGTTTNYAGHPLLPITVRLAGERGSPADRHCRLPLATV